MIDRIVANESSVKASKTAPKTGEKGPLAANFHYPKLLDKRLENRGKGFIDG
jgi:hypothetical protein